MAGEAEVEYGLRQHLMYLAGRSVPAAIGLVAVVVYSHVFDATTYGDYAIIMAIANIVIGSLLVWIRITMTRYVAGGERADAMLGVALVLQAAVSLAVVLVMALAALATGSEVLLLAALAALALSWSDFNLDLLRATHHARRFSLQYLVRQLLSVGGVFAAMALQLPVNALAVGLIAANLLSSLTLIGQLRGRDLRFQPAELGQFTGYGVPLAANYVVASLTTSLDRLLIAWLLGREAAGVYALAADIVWQILSVIMDGVTLAFLPYAARTLDTQGAAAAAGVLRQNLLILLGIALPAAMGFAVCGPPLATLALGPEFGATAVLLIPVLATANLFRGLRIYFLENVFQLAQRSLVAAGMTSVAAILLAALIVVLTPTLGVAGGAVALLVSSVIALILGLELARPLLLQRYPLRDVGKIAVASICSTLAALLVLLAWPAPIAVVAAIPAGVAVYALVLYAVDPGNLRRELAAALAARRKPKAS